MITVIGLGYGGEGGITLGALTKLKTAQKVYLRTGECAAAEFIAEMGIAFSTMDDLFEDADDFDKLNRAAAERVVLEGGDGTVYAVPGTGSAITDSSVAQTVRLAEENGIETEYICGISYADAALACVGVNAEAPVRIMSCADIEKIYLDVRSINVITEIYSSTAASTLKLALMECFGDETPIWLCTAGKSESLTAKQIMLYELDRQKEEAYGHLCGVITLPITELTANERFDFEHLSELVGVLRAPGGCPWDAVQTHTSIKQDLIEEAYETAETIDNEDMDKLCDELGDVLLQVVFHSRIASEHGEFSWRDVTTSECKKLIQRHTHVFGSDVANTEEEVKRNWEKNKNNADGQTVTQAMMRTRKGLPALMGAGKVQNKAALVGFDFADAEAAYERLLSECEELGKALRDGDESAINDELGDVLFSAVNVARLRKIVSETALAKATDKFINRFNAVENEVKNSGREWKEWSAEELDAVWERVKTVKND